MATKIIQWNINGLHAHTEFLEKLIQDESPDIICIQETNFKLNSVKKIKNFKSLHKNRTNCLAASGGIVIYVNNNIHCEEIKLNTKLEAIACYAIINSKKISICNLYIPNSHFLQKSEITDLIKELPKPYIIMGDFNSHNTLWGSKTTDTRGKMIENTLNDLNLILLNSTQPTHHNISNGSFSSIDLSICEPSLADHLEWNVLEELYSSDHFPITINIENNYSITQTSSNRWKYKKADWNKYKSTINNNITKLKNPIDCFPAEINEIVSNFEKLILDAATESIPKTISKYSTKYTPWWTEECETAIKEQKHAFNVYKKHRTNENKTEFKLKRAIARRTLKKSKKESWQIYISTITNQTNTDTVWKKLKSMKGQTKGTAITALTTPNKSITSDPIEIANLLAEAFAQNSSDENFDKKFLTYKNNIEQQMTHHVHTPPPEEIVYINTKIEEAELLSTLKSCKNSSPGPDGIPNIFIKELPYRALKYLQEIYNLIWQNNVFPDAWHKATVIPIPKPDKIKLNPGSYRPIALTSCLCKLLEKIINKRLIWYLEKNKILSKHQSGFRQTRSTTDSLLTLETNICDAIANNNHLAAVSLDIEKAYDMVWRQRVIELLKLHGLQGNITDFITNFLEKRLISVRTNDQNSDYVEIANGVPQGSVISVTLFLIAINDIVNDLEKPVKCIIFADDMTIFVSGKNIKTSEEILQKSLDKLQRFSEKTGFRFSKTKSKAIVFSRCKGLQELNLSLENLKLQNTKEIKILGLTFDHRLTWIPHLKKLKDECNRSLNIIKALSSKDWGAEAGIIRNTYISLIRPKIDYGSIIYNSTTTKILNMLNPINNTAARLSIGAFRTSPVESLLCEAQLPTLDQRRRELTINYMLKTATNPNIPIYERLFSQKYADKYQKKTRTPKPIDLRIQKYLQEINFEVPKIAQIKPFQTPPWTIKKPQIINHQTSSSKEDTNTTLLQNIHIENTNKYPDHIKIYTDGSKSKNGTGCAMITETTEILTKLPNYFSIFSTEAYAILQAIKHIEDSNETLFLINTDSKSVLLALQNTKSKNQIIRQTIEKIANLKSKDIIFQWVPAHINIPGNERADDAAKRATTLATVQPEIPVQYEELKGPIQKMLKNLQNEQWKNSRHTYLKTTREDIFELSPALTFKRNDQVRLTRLKIGHTNLTHIHLITKEDPNMCHNCNEVLTLQHLLLQCPSHRESRTKHNINEETIRLKNRQHCKNVIMFLKETNMYTKL